MLHARTPCAKHSKFYLRFLAQVEQKDEHGETMMMIAAYMGHKDVIQALLDHKGDVNAVSKEGVTSLMRAAAAGKADVLKLLLSHNATVDARSNFGWTLLIFAVRLGTVAISFVQPQC